MNTRLLSRAAILVLASGALSACDEPAEPALPSADTAPREVALGR